MKSLTEDVLHRKYKCFGTRGAKGASSLLEPNLQHVWKQL